MTVALLLCSTGCALGLWWGYRTSLDLWDVTRFVWLLHGGLLSAALASGLGWRDERALVRVGPRVLGVGFALFWAHTWCEPLQRLVVWLDMVRFLWLQT